MPGTETQAQETMLLNMGPQHPGTHGVLRLKLTLDGERVLDVEPIIGYLHRSLEKLAERGRYLHFIPLTNRLDYVASFSYEAAYVKTVEELIDLEVPERANYIRVIGLELDRIQSHLVWLGTFGLDIGALNALWYTFREREMILDLFQMLTGARMNLNFNRFGGVKADLPEGFEVKVRAVLDEIFKKVDEYEDFLKESDTFLLRTRGVGVLKPQDAIDQGTTGPNLRASGVKFDLRKDDPYFAYGDLDFEVPIQGAGDCYARFIVRMEEIRQSVKIIRQALDRLPNGPVIALGLEKGWQLLVKPDGETYGHLEGPRGEIGFYIVGDGTTRPYRVKIRSPSFQNLSALPDMVRGALIPDLVATNGSIDLVLGDVDR
ncbi:MAG: NADH-quinone oxidoreductase subunit D [Candidatus Bipolaricaulia bacterium]